MTPVSPSHETLWHRLVGQRSSVRQGFLLLLLAAMLPLIALATARSALILRENRDRVAERLSEQALAVAEREGQVAATAQAMLTLLANNDRVRAGGATCDQALAQVAQDFAAFSSFGRIDTDGNLTCSAQPLTAAESVIGMRWWPLAREKRRFFISGPYWGTLSRRNILWAILPLENPAGAFDGALVGSIDLGWMETSLQQRTLGENSIVMAVNGEGQVLYASRAVTFPPFDLSGPPGDVGQIRDKQGVRWTYATAPLMKSEHGSQVLHVAYAVPHAAMFSFAWWQAGLTILTPIVTILVVGLVIWFGTGRLVLRWLADVRGLARAYAAGDFASKAADFHHAPAEFRDVAAALHKMGSTIERREQALREAVHQQKQLGREVHHRVRNNLQIVLSLIGMQSARISDPSAAVLLRQTQLRLGVIALVHRLVYEQGELASLSGDALLLEVCRMLNAAYPDDGRITLDCKFDPIALPLDAAVPVAIWVLEKVSNAYLHGFPDGREGLVTARLEALSETEALLTVADDGVGFDAGAPNVTTGLRMMRAIAGQLGGTMDLQSSADGTSATLKFPYRAQISEAVF